MGQQPTVCAGPGCEKGCWEKDRPPSTASELEEPATVNPESWRASTGSSAGLKDMAAPNEKSSAPVVPLAAAAGEIDDGVGTDAGTTVFVSETAQPQATQSGVKDGAFTEKRLTENGNAYTHFEFLEAYGPVEGPRKWASATRAPQTEEPKTEKADGAEDQQFPSERPDYSSQESGLGMVRRVSSKNRNSTKDQPDYISRANSQLAVPEERSRRSLRVSQMGCDFPKRPLMCKLSKRAWDKLELLFRNMDGFNKNAITHEDALAYFKGTFKSLSADAFFKEVDADQSGVITADEFMAFWVQVRNSGYKEEEMMMEIDELLEGAPWVDWKDDRNAEITAVKSFPKRPMLCKLSSKAWKKCEELFNKMDLGGRRFITKEDAYEFFQGDFKKFSVDGMFNEIDQLDHGRITPDSFMAFWVQVRSTGYKDKDIIRELDNLLAGGAWVDWDDGRSTDKTASTGGKKTSMRNA